MRVIYPDLSLSTSSDQQKDITGGDSEMESTPLASAIPKKGHIQEQSTLKRMIDSSEKPPSAKRERHPIPSQQQTAEGMRTVQVKSKDDLQLPPQDSHSAKEGSHDDTANEGSKEGKPAPVTLRDETSRMPESNEGDKGQCNLSVEMDRKESELQHSSSQKELNQNMAVQS